jgi:hypothetical protein
VEMMVRNPLKIPRNIRVKRRPYNKELAFLYDYKIIDSAPTKTELKLRQRPKSEKIIKNPFQKSGYLGLKRRD